MFDMNLNYAEMQQEYRRNLLREAELARLAQSVQKQGDMMQMARNVVGRSLVAVGNQLLDSAKR